MNKYFNKVFVFAAIMMSTMSAEAQIDLGKIVSQVTGGNTSSAVNNLVSVFEGSKQASKENLVGVWVYSEPAIMFESNNILAKAGSKIAANKIESTLQTYLSKYGIKPGSLTVVFKEDGTFTSTIKGKKGVSGKWQVVNSKLNLTFTGMKTVQTTTQLEGKELMFVADATKLLNLFKGIAGNSNNSSLQTVASLMKSVNGMKAGFALKKN